MGRIGRTTHGRRQEGVASPPTPLPKGEGCRKIRGEVTTDAVQDARRAVQDFVVRKTKHGKASSRKPSVAAAVARWSGEVRSTICLEELGLHDLSAAQHMPELLFGGSGTAAQSTRLEGPGSEQAGHAWLSAARRTWLPPFLFPAPLSLRERGWG